MFLSFTKIQGIRTSMNLSYICTIVLLYGFARQHIPGNDVTDTRLTNFSWFLKTTMNYIIYRPVKRLMLIRSPCVDGPLADR